MDHIEGALSAAQPTAEIEIVGQKLKIPMTGWTCAIMMVIGLVVVSGLQVATRDSDLVRDVASLVVGKGNSDGEFHPEQQRILRFWTPSVDTKLELERAGATPSPWDIADSAKIHQFENILMSELHAQGFSRWAVDGMGTSRKLKRGLYWEVTSDVSNVNLDRRIFLKRYAEFWGKDQDIYLQEIITSKTIFSSLSSE